MRHAKPLLLAVGSALGLGLGISGTAHAHAYALSSNHITNFQLSGLTTLPGTASGAFADHGDVAGSVTTNDALDAPQAFQSPTDTAPAENSFTPVGMAGNYARGDAAYLSLDVLTGNGEAANIAETFIESGSGQGEGGNLLGVDLAFDTTTDVSFSFDADPYMEVGISPHSTGAANADLTFSLTITDALGQEIYAFAPAALNQAIQTLNTGTEAFWDPTGDGMGGTTLAFGDTISLDPGSYALDISMTESATTRAQDITIPVPLPGTLALLGGGLLGLVGVTRRRRR